MALAGKTNQEKLDSLCFKTYKDQGIWFLNAFWTPSGKQNAEQVWQYVHKMNDLDEDKHAAGNEVDELQSHRFLEFFKETLTVMQMRNKLRDVGVDKNIKRKMVPLTHFLIFHFSADWNALVNFQLQDQEAVRKAQRMLEEVIEAFTQVQKKADEARKSEHEAKAREKEAKQKEAEAKAAQQELEVALAELKKQEDEYRNKTQELQQRTETGGNVARNKAKAELAQHLSADPLPLRRAKINQEAAVRKAEKATQAAAEATAAAKKARLDATAAAELAEAAVEEARNKVAAAEAYLKEMESKPGVAHGDLWWIDRELQEQKKFLPQRKGGVGK